MINTEVAAFKQREKLMLQSALPVLQAASLPGMEV